MTVLRDHPLPGERVHAKHPELPGALCQVWTTTGPWVTREPARVTCRACLKQLGHDVAPTATSQPGRVHARSLRFGASDRPLCSIPSIQPLSFSDLATEVTCGTCRRLLRKAPAEATSKPARCLAAYCRRLAMVGGRYCTVHVRRGEGEVARG